MGILVVVTIKSRPSVYLHRLFTVRTSLYQIKMSKEPDQELKKAFIELQGKMQETNQKLRIADVQVESLKKQIVHAQLTDKEIESLGESTRVYESVGRMFLLTDIPQVRTGLKAKSEKCNEKISTLMTSKEHLERSLNESQNNLREMIKLKQSTTSA